MKYLLDSNACIGYLNGRAIGVLRRLKMLSSKEIAVCSVVKAELFYGAMRSVNPSQALAKQRAFLDCFMSLPFDDQAAEFYGQTRARLAIQGLPIGPNDLMIASIALAHQLVLVTHNIREFSRVDGLQVEDWE